MKKFRDLFLSFIVLLFSNGLLLVDNEEVVHVSVVAAIISFPVLVERSPILVAVGPRSPMVFAYIFLNNWLVRRPIYHYPLLLRCPRKVMRAVVGMPVF